MKDIPGFEGIYAATSCGKIWSHRNQKFLKPFITKKGYCLICLCVNHRKKTYKLHRLIAMTYLDNPLGLSEVNHKDECKTHNNIQNLEYCDKVYNNNYGTRNERIKKANSKAVRCIETGEVFESQTEAGKQLGIPASSISSYLKGRLKTAGGYHWECVDITT